MYGFGQRAALIMLIYLLALALFVSLYCPFCHEPVLYYWCTVAAAWSCDA